MTRRFLPNPTSDIDPWDFTIPVNVLWGIYARQSTPGQLIKYTESTEMQTADLIIWLQNRGIEDNYILFDADLGLSGILRIDERPALREVIRRIKADEIKAVLVYQVSRLFRDLTGIQYNTFADDCKQHNCILVTAHDGMLFNFNNPIHLKMFRFLAEAAAEYLQQQIGLLHEARLRRARNGFYVHMGNVPSGFLVDYDQDNPTFRKLIPYLPHQDIILDRLYRRYYSLSGDFSALCHELNEMPYVFPFFEQWVDRRIVNQWKQRVQNGGYSLTRKGIITCMTNPANIGWWIVQGDIISRSNHDPLVPEDEQFLFWYAFERLAEYTTDKEKNQLRVLDRPKRYYQRDTNPTEGLLKDRIVSPDGKVQVHLKEGSQHYAIYPPHTIYVKDLQEIESRLIDEAFLTVFFNHLKETHSLDGYRKWVSIETTNHESLMDTLEGQLRKIASAQDAIMNEIITIKAQIAQTEQDRKALEAEYAPYLERLRTKYTMLEKPKKEITAKLKDQQTSDHYQALRQFADYQTELAKLIPVFRQKPFSVQKEFINLTVTEAILQVIAPHWIQLDIVWSHPQWIAQRLYLQRPYGPRPIWTEEEKQLLLLHFPSASKQDLLQLFPSKNWLGIAKMGSVMRIHRDVQRPYAIPAHLSWLDLQFMQQENIFIPSSCQRQEDENTVIVRELATQPHL